MATHNVWIEIRPDKKFKYDVECLCVFPGDKIKWHLKNPYPFGIMVKALVSPLDCSYKVTGAGRVITARVRDDAEPGYYLYGVGAWDRQSLLFDDPEIIVRRP